MCVFTKHFINHDLFFRRWEHTLFQSGYDAPYAAQNILCAGAYGFILWVMGMKSVCLILLDHSLTIENKDSDFTRYYLTSLTDVERFAYASRKHWSIENQLHWCLDVIFDEDGSRARKDLSPLNLNVLRKAALALCRNIDLGKCQPSEKALSCCSLSGDFPADSLWKRLNAVALYLI